MQPSHITLPQNLARTRTARVEKKFRDRKISGSMARAAAGIGESFARFGDELSIVGAGLEGKFQDAESGGIAQFAVGLWFDEGAVILTACTDDELANAAGGICHGIRSLRSEALVIVVVTADDDIRVAI